MIIYIKQVPTESFLGAQHLVLTFFLDKNSVGNESNVLSGSSAFNDVMEVDLGALKITIWMTW